MARSHCAVPDRSAVEEAFAAHVNGKVDAYRALRTEAGDGRA